MLDEERDLAGLGTDEPLEDDVVAPELDGADTEEEEEGLDIEE